jgi:hypothetical protein
MRIDKEKFNQMWTEIFNRLQFVPPNTGEQFYLSGCLDTMRKIKEQMEERENEEI